MEELHRKYRPTDLKHFYGNKDLIKTLQDYEKDTIPHAILFHGPSRCGKTTLARLLGKKLGADIGNFEFPLIETNAAQNRGIDDAKKIIEQSHFKNVLIVDEAHALTPEAQSALLKIVEEPHKNFYIYFCTTEPNKLIKPLRNRFTECKVSALTDDEMDALLFYVMKKEHMKARVAGPGEIIRKKIIRLSKGIPGIALKTLQAVRDANINLDTIADKDNPEQEVRKLLFSSALQELVCSGVEFSKKDLPPKVLLMEPWLETSTLTMVAGESGSGKSWFAMETACALADGRSAFNGLWSVPAAVPVLYLDGEMHWADTKKRIEYLQWKNADVFSKTEFEFKGVDIPINLANERIRDDLTNFILKRGYRFIVIDNLTSLLFGISFSSDLDWQPLNQWLLKLRAHNVSVLIVHHTRKDKKDQLGTVTRIHQLDNYFDLKPKPIKTVESKVAFGLEEKKSRATRLNVADTVFTCTNGAWTVKNEKPSAVATSDSLDERNKEIAKLLLKGIPQKDIAEKYEFNSKGSVSNIKKDLIKKTYIRKNREGKIRLTVKGKEWIS